MNRSGIALAMTAAALFGLSTPFAKLLLAHVGPWTLAGLFYLGAGIGLAIVRATRPARATETAIVRRDTPWLLASILAGGVAGPLLLMLGLDRTSAAAASLMLTLEGVATALLAWFIFRENFDRRVLLGMSCIIGGAAMLAYQGAFSITGVVGPLAIAGACFAWGIDNNLTRRISLADPVQVAMLKGLAAGPVNLALGLAVGERPPALLTGLAAGLVGFLGYGVSLALFIRALRDLGTARTAAYFSTAPFIGAVLAIPIVGETYSIQLLAAGALMAAGVWLHATERHIHEHEHEPIEHSHRHAHDEHHRHTHEPSDPPDEPHTHRHVHARLRHSHPHVPDAHHRHKH